MGLLSKLKSLLGVDDSERSAGSGVDVTVEHDPDADGESADGDERAAAAAAATTESSDDDATAAETTAEDATEATAEDAAADDGDATDDGPGAAEDDVDVEDVKGVGPAYADRLRDAGVETVADLAAADADDLAAATDLSAKRVGRWIERAQDRP